MKRNVLGGIKEVYGLTETPDYSRFIVQGGAPQMMHDNWARLGVRFNGSIKKVIKEHDQQKKAA